jgi:HK97 family phage portal protein
VVFLSQGEPVALAGGFADETPMFANRDYYANTRVALSGNVATYAAIYSEQLWVNTLVSKIAWNTARLPLKVYERSELGRQDRRDTPFGKLIQRPNARQDPFFFWLWTVSTFEVYGEAFWVKIRPRPGMAPISLEPLHPVNVVTRRNDTGELEYVYYNGTATSPVIVWPESEIVAFRNYNPRNTARGLSRIEPLRATLLAEDAARRASASMWQNGARPSMALSHPGRLSDDAMRRLKGQWDSMHAGVDNWAKTAVLEEGMTPHQMQLSAEEMQYVTSRQLNREECCAAYDVPPPVVHILERATFSNITEQMRSMYRDTMAPRLSLFESVLDHQLRPDFDPSGSLYAEFLLDEVLRGAFEQRTEAYQKAIQSGWMKPAEVRQAENLPDAGPEADKLYINAATIPMEVIAATPPSGTDIIVHPQPVKALTTGCHECGTDTKELSKRGLCSPCEGRRGRRIA